MARQRLFERSQLFNRLVKEIKRVEVAFRSWGQAFTYDCTKEKRNKHTKWFERNIKHVERVASKTKSRLSC